MGRYKYLIVCFGSIVLLLVKYPTVLTNIFQDNYSATSNFDPNKVYQYTSEELQRFLNSSQEQIKPTNIASIANQIAKRDGATSAQATNCANCEESLLHVSKALSNSQKKLEKYEAEDDSPAFGKIAIFLLTAISTGYSFWLSGQKRSNPDKTNYYETRLDQLNFVSIISIGLLGVFF